MTLTELAENYIGQRLTVIHEFYGNFEEHHRRLRWLITNEINPLLIKHGAEPISLDLVPDPDEPDDDVIYDDTSNTWSG
jgi:hypothetical protein